MPSYKDVFNAICKSMSDVSGHAQVEDSAKQACFYAIKNSRNSCNSRLKAVFSRQNPRKTVTKPCDFGQNSAAPGKRKNHNLC